MSADVQELAERAQARIGEVLKHKWRLDAYLGSGGMASVFAATHRNGHRVAIKMLHVELSLNAEVRKRFLREGYTANAVSHPGLVRVLDDDVSEDGAAFLVMDLLEGETLEARAQRIGGPLRPSEVLSITHAVLDVLIAAHARGVVHRDIKPENIFVTTDGVIKVLDFGIAQVRDVPQVASVATRSGSMLGTPAYMSPEQALGRTQLIDPRSDLWSVGATMYRLLSGRTVHIGSTLNEQLVLAATQPATPLESVAPGVPAPVVEVVARAVAFERDARFVTARQMQDAVTRAARAIDDPSAPLLDAAASTTVIAAVAPPSAVASSPGTPPRPPQATETSLLGASAATSPSAGHRVPKHSVGLIVGASVAVGVALAAVLVARVRTSATTDAAHAVDPPASAVSLPPVPGQVAAPEAPPRDSAVPLPPPTSTPEEAPLEADASVAVHPTHKAPVVPPPPPPAKSAAHPSNSWLDQR
jgi:serine/threonine protein kinase